MLYLNLLFIVVLLIYLPWLWSLMNSLNSDAPFVPIDKEHLQALIRLAKPRPGETWVDLGSGDGRILIAACRQAQVNGIGIEKFWGIRQWSRLKVLAAGLRQRITIRSGDLFKADVSEADIISIYLLPTTMRTLLPRLRQQSKPGSRLVAHRYVPEGVTVESSDPEHKIYLVRL